MENKKIKIKCPVCNKLFDTQTKCDEHDNKVHPFISGDDMDEAMGIPPRDKDIEINDLKDEIKKLKLKLKRRSKNEKN